MTTAVSNRLNNIMSEIRRGGIVPCAKNCKSLVAKGYEKRNAWRLVNMTWLCPSCSKQAIIKKK